MKKFIANVIMWALMALFVLFIILPAFLILTPILWSLEVLDEDCARTPKYY